MLVVAAALGNEKEELRSWVWRCAQQAASFVVS